MVNVSDLSICSGLHAFITVLSKWVLYVTLGSRGSHIIHVDWVVWSSICIFLACVVF